MGTEPGTHDSSSQWTCIPAQTHPSQLPGVNAWPPGARSGSGREVPAGGGATGGVPTACGQPPHLGAVVVQLEGQRHGPVDVDLLGPVDVLRADLPAGSCALPGKLGSLRVGGGADRSFMGAWEQLTYFPMHSAYSQRAEVGHQLPGCHWIPPHPHPRGPGGLCPVSTVAARAPGSEGTCCVSARLFPSVQCRPAMLLSPSEPQMPFTPTPRGVW